MVRTCLLRWPIVAGLAVSVSGLCSPGTAAEGYQGHRNAVEVFVGRLTETENSEHGPGVGLSHCRRSSLIRPSTIRPRRCARHFCRMQRLRAAPPQGRRLS